MGSQVFEPNTYLSRTRGGCGWNLNREHLETHAGEPDLTARIESFELAYRMQTKATDLADFSNESAETQQLYGLDKDSTRTFGRKCLLARRLVDRGVRFVQDRLATHDDNFAVR